MVSLMNNDNDEMFLLSPGRGKDGKNLSSTHDQAPSKKDVCVLLGQQVRQTHTAFIKVWHLNTKRLSYLDYFGHSNIPIMCQ